MPFGSRFITSGRSATTGSKAGDTDVTLGSDAVLIGTGANASEDGEGKVYIAIASAEGVVERAAHIVGGVDRTRAGGVEMALDCMRRHLHGLPVHEPIDFERT